MKANGTSVDIDRYLTSRRRVWLVGFKKQKKGYPILLHRLSTDTRKRTFKIHAEQTNVNSKAIIIRTVVYIFNPAPHHHMSHVQQCSQCFSIFLFHMPLPAVHGGQIVKKVRPNKQYRRVSRLPVETRNGRRLGNVWGLSLPFLGRTRTAERINFKFVAQRVAKNKCDSDRVYVLNMSSYFWFGGGGATT